MTCAVAYVRSAQILGAGRLSVMQGYVFNGRFR
jgi:hypothetical protein